MHAARAVRAIFTEAGAVLHNTANGATFTINSMGAKIWRHLTKGATKDEIVDRLGSEFGVSRDQIYGDVDEFLTGLEQRDLLQKDIYKTE